MVLFDRDYVLYYSGFAFIPTERPIGFVMNAQGERALKESYDLLQSMTEGLGFGWESN